MRPIADGHLEAKLLCASIHNNDQCGSNGLPLTPNSIRIIGKFQFLTALSHPNLCCYVDLKRGKHEQVMVVAEGHKQNLSLRIKAGNCNTTRDAVCKFTKQMLLALDFLHENKITHRNMSPCNIQFDSEDTIKLSDYGLYFMTENGANVPFPIGDPACAAPEVFILESELVEDSGPRRRTKSSSDETALLNPPSPTTVDVWSLGVVLLQLIAGERLWAGQPVHDTVEFLINLLLSDDTNKSAYTRLLREFSTEGQQRLKMFDSDIIDLINKCLIIDPTLRPTTSELLLHRCVCTVDASCPQHILSYKPLTFNAELRCADLSLDQINDLAPVSDDYAHLKERTYSEVYHLWRLAGGDLETVLMKWNIIKDTPPVINTCSFVSEEGDEYGMRQDSSIMYTDQHVVLDLCQLYDRLSEVDPEDYYPLILSEGFRSTKQSVLDSAKLPLVIRERDVEYQFHRLVLFDRLIKGYPHTKSMLLKEARVDIPPLVRPYVWAAILDIQGNIHDKYESIDKMTSQAIDRQIEVDIPRCHQYNELMSSPEAHRKLKRILKAWVASHPQYVYWQGLDSLTAPFLYLNFNDEALAYACLTKFIHKYLYNFFLKDNSAVVQEYLALFSQLITFHEPELSNHLDDIGFAPDLYAIPWFLTMYAHVFPLHRLFHLWDTLLLGASVFPLCVGVAILQQLKSRLLTFGFNECILLFSDLPEINIEQCVTDSVKVFCSTPKSSTLRIHVAPSIARQPSPEYAKPSYERAWVAEPLPLDELKRQRCCRISAEEMLSLLSPSSDWKQSKPKLVVIDIRSVEEYQKGTILGSLNCPCQRTSDLDDKLLLTSVKEFLDAYKYQVKVVVDTNNSHSGEFAHRLVTLGYSKVCYLHKGMSILRGSNLLVVPSPNM